MKILIISDIHNNKNFIDFLKNHSDFIIIILGDFIINESILKDLNVIYVKGNCDLKSYDNIEKIITINNKIFYLVHGHTLNVKYTLNNLIYRAFEVKSNFCLFGHTHIQECFIEENVYFLNPGAFLNNEYAYIVENTIYLYKNNKLIKKINMLVNYDN